ncbi:MAG: glycosyltransferase family protein [Rhodospirillaceae bacterium]
MKAAVIVQARMASTRLPGKVLMDLGGRSVLAHVLTRCKAIAGADAVCCAVPKTPDCAPLIAAAEALGVHVFQGDEDDVLARYHGAAKMLGTETILRVTSDCPLIDPAICARVLAEVTEGGTDFACINMPPSWPHGLDCEAVSFTWLDRANAEAEKKFQREHVLPWVRENPHVRKANVAGPGGGVEHHRWTLDNDRDLEFLRALWPRLPGDGPESWPYTVPLAIVEADPALAAINAGQDRLEGLKKSMQES